MSNNSLIPLILILVFALFVSWALFIIVRFVQETAKIKKSIRHALKINVMEICRKRMSAEDAKKELLHIFENNSNKEVRKNPEHYLRICTSEIIVEELTKHDTYGYAYPVNDDLLNTLKAINDSIRPMHTLPLSHRNKSFVRTCERYIHLDQKLAAIDTLSFIASEISVLECARKNQFRQFSVSIVLTVLFGLVSIYLGFHESSGSNSVPSAEREQTPPSDRITAR